MKNTIEHSDQQQMDSVKTSNSNKTTSKGQIMKRDFYSVWRILANEEKLETYRLLEVGEFKEVILCKSYSGRTLSNLPRRFGGANRYTWGYSGTGPGDLARSILLHFSNEDLEFTHKYSRDFMVEIIARLPMGESIAINSDFILDWISDARSSEPKYECVYRPEACGSDFVYNDEYQVIKKPLLLDTEYGAQSTTTGARKYVR